MSDARLFLVRHGETVWHHDNRYAGAVSDVDLTARGRRQAAGLADWAVDRGVTAVVASTVRRAVETAQPSADRLGVGLTVEPDLREVDFGVAEGRTKDELRDVDADMVERFAADPVANPYPGSEPPDEVARRVGAALRRIAVAHVGREVLVVAHNTALRLGLCDVLELPARRYRHLFPVLENAAITEIVLPADGAAASLVRLNAPHAPRVVRDHHTGTPDRAPAPRKEQR